MCDVECIISGGGDLWQVSVENMPVYLEHPVVWQMRLLPFGDDSGVDAFCLRAQAYG